MRQLVLGGGAFLQLTTWKWVLVAAAQTISPHRRQSEESAGSLVYMSNISRAANQIVLAASSHCGAIMQEVKRPAHLHRQSISTISLRG